MQRSRLQRWPTQKSNLFLLQGLNRRRISQLLPAASDHPFHTMAKNQCSLTICRVTIATHPLKSCIHSQKYTMTNLSSQIMHSRISQMFSMIIFTEETAICSMEIRYTTDIKLIWGECTMLSKAQRFSTMKISMQECNRCLSKTTSSILIRVCLKRHKSMVNRWIKITTQICNIGVVLRRCLISTLFNPIIIFLTIIMDPFASITTILMDMLRLPKCMINTFLTKRIIRNSIISRMQHISIHSRWEHRISTRLPPSNLSISRNKFLCNHSKLCNSSKLFKHKLHNTPILTVDLFSNPKCKCNHQMVIQVLCPMQCKCIQIIMQPVPLMSINLRNAVITTWWHSHLLMISRMESYRHSQWSLILTPKLIITLNEITMKISPNKMKVVKPKVLTQSKMTSLMRFLVQHLKWAIMNSPYMSDLDLRMSPISKADRMSQLLILTITIITKEMDN